jgi:broad specificity phosphatase PhoE
MLTVRFVRHGESLANAGGVTSEQHAIPLTDRGRSQALAFADALHTPPALFITSPYIRARDTAAPSAARHAHVPLQVWPVQEIGILATARCLNTTSLQRLPMVEAHWAGADPLHCDGDGAESYTAFVARVRDALARLAALDVAEAMVFSHGQFMNGVLWEIERGGLAVTAESMLGFRGFHSTAPIENIKGFTARWEGAWTIVQRGDLPRSNIAGP